MLHYVIKSSLVAVTLLVATGGAQASEPLSTEVMRSVEQVLLIQSQTMLQEAVMELKLELADSLSQTWVEFSSINQDAQSESAQAAETVSVSAKQ